MNDQSVALGRRENTLSDNLLYDFYRQRGDRKISTFMEMVTNMTSFLVVVDDFESMETNSGGTLATAILVACGPSLEVALNGDGTQLPDSLFALHNVTPEQQAKAQQWLAECWYTCEKTSDMDDSTLAGVSRKPVPELSTRIPSYGKSAWWKFVSRFMQATLGFDVKEKKSSQDVAGGSAAIRYKLVACGFWDTYGIDLVQVGLAYRKRILDAKITGPRETIGPREILHNGRPYGILPKRMRKCDRCPAEAAETWCVRQNGTQWLCTLDGFTVPTVYKCHRHWGTPVDTGYLDEECKDEVLADHKPMGAMEKS
jgi:hypothetical protein